MLCNAINNAIDSCIRDYKYGGDAKLCSYYTQISCSVATILTETTPHTKVGNVLVKFPMENTGKKQNKLHNMFSEVLYAVQQTLHIVSPQVRSETITQNLLEDTRI